MFEQRKALYTNKIIYDIATRARKIENEQNLPDPTTAIFVLLDSDLTSDELLKMQCLEAATSSLALAKKVLYIWFMTKLFVYHQYKWDTQVV